MTHWVAERTIDYIGNSDDPFFCVISVFDPHNPYRDYLLEIGDLTDEAKIPDSFVLESDFEETLPTLKCLSIEGGNTRKLSKEELRRVCRLLRIDNQHQEPESRTHPIPLVQAREDPAKFPPPAEQSFYFISLLVVLLVRLPRIQAI